MGTIPAPNIAGLAGDIARSPLEEYGRAQQLQSQAEAMKQQQMQTQVMHQQLADQQAMTSALHDWDGKDFEALPDLMRKHGISAPAYLQAQQQVLARKQQLTTLDKEQLANMGAHHDAALGVLNAHEEVPDEQLPQSITEAAQQLAQQGHIDPAHAQQVAQMAQTLPPDQLRSQLDIFKKGLLGEKEQIAQAQKDRELTAKEQEAQAKVTSAQTGAKKLEAEMPGGPLYTPTPEKEFQSYYQSYLGAKGLQPSARNEFNARQQYFKDKQPYGAARIELQREGLDIRQQQADRQDTNFIDKNYVKPANDAEKSYQMFMDAYNNRNNAKTGAPSMLALSTHLATTFGNVKGSRVTKDMIQEHLGARGISDKALVAVQKLTNGDVLSENQWNEFRDLIANSRRLNWEAAQKEAKRRNVDISGSLPADLQGGGGSKNYWDQFGVHQ